MLVLFLPPSLLTLPPRWRDLLLFRSWSWLLLLPLLLGDGDEPSRLRTPMATRCDRPGDGADDAAAAAAASGSVVSISGRRGNMSRPVAGSGMTRDELGEGCWPRETDMLGRGREDRGGGAEERWDRAIGWVLARTGWYYGW